MRRFFGIGRLDDRFLLPTADAFQCAGDPERIAGELDRGGIGKKLALARNRRLDQPRKENPGIADPQKERPKNKNRSYDADAAFAIVAVSA